jgi:enterochelin esterase-like enzyme
MLFETALLLQFIDHARGRQAVRSSLAAEWSEMSERHRQGDARKRARSKWLHANGAEASFPCGVVEVEGSSITAIVAIVPDGLAFLAETPVDVATDDVLEVGRIAAPSIVGVDVIDADENHVPEPAGESFEPDAAYSMVLRWTDEDDAHEDRFAFRSSWTAWQAAKRLRKAQRP